MALTLALGEQELGWAVTFEILLPPQVTALRLQALLRQAN